MASIPAGKRPAPRKTTPAKKPATAKKVAGKVAPARKTASPAAKKKIAASASVARSELRNRDKKAEAEAVVFGRPTDFRLEFVDQARKLAMLGATDIEVADFFGVSVRTVHRWKATMEDFCHSLKAGKSEADDRVERSLFSRANGYEHDEVDIRVVNGEIVQTPIRKYYPPDTTAAIFWLKNRRPEDWREKIENTHVGPDGGPIQARIAVEFVKPPARGKGADE